MFRDDLISNRRMLFPEPGFWLGKQHPPGRPPFIFSFHLLKYCIHHWQAPPIIWNITALHGSGKAIVHLISLSRNANIYEGRSLLPSRLIQIAIHLPPCQFYTASPQKMEAMVGIGVSAYCSIIRHLVRQTVPTQQPNRLADVVYRSVGWQLFIRDFGCRHVLL